MLGVFIVIVQLVLPHGIALTALEFPAYVTVSGLVPDGKTNPVIVSVLRLVMFA